MKSLFLVLVIAFFALATSSVLRLHDDENTSIDSQWEDFKATHGKHYPTLDEEYIRKQIFTENVRQIEIHNYMHSKGLKTFRMGINRFTDMDASEVAKQMNGFSMAKYEMRVNGSAYLSPNAPLTLPTAVDWRPLGYVTPIKDQGPCGSCWAFSATGSLEGQTYRKTGRLVSLSEQNLVDCSLPEGNFGCAGGLMDYAFTYVKVNGGIDTEQSYPYDALDGKCMYNASNVGARCTGFVDIPTGDEQKLMEAVATVGPVSVAIDASQMSFQAYKDGVYIDAQCSSTQLDHGVLVVGYGSQNGVDYWIVKNSWGLSWGNEGYIWMARHRNNQCGIATAASYPLV